MVLKRAPTRDRLSPGEFKTMKKDAVGVSGAGGGGVVDIVDAASARLLEIDRSPARAPVFYRQELREELPVLYLGASTVEALEPAAFKAISKKRIRKK